MPWTGRCRSRRASRRASGNDWCSRSSSARTSLSEGSSTVALAGREGAAVGDGLDDGLLVDAFHLEPLVGEVDVVLPGAVTTWMGLVFVSSDLILEALR